MSYRTGSQAQLTSNRPEDVAQVTAFVAEQLRTGPQLRLRKTVTYFAYKFWTQSHEPWLRLLTPRAFTMAMASLGITLDRSNKCYEGVELRR